MLRLKKISMFMFTLQYLLCCANLISNEAFAAEATPSWQWSKRLGGSSNDYTYSVAFDSAGNVIVAGYVYANADVNGDGDSSDGGAEDGTNYGGYDIIVSKFDATGTWQWAKRLGGTSSDYGYGVVADSNNNVIVTGYVTGNADMNGDGDSTDGNAESNTGYGSSDAFYSVFDASGTWVRAKRLGGTGADYGYSVVTDGSNNVIVAGYVTNNADMNGDADNTDGNAESSTGYGSADIFLSKFDSSGTWQWAKRLGGTNIDKAMDIAVDSAAGIIVTGSVYGNADMNGDADSTDGGAEDGTNYGGYDIFVSKFDSSGTWQWAKRLGITGTSYEDRGYSVTTDSANDVIIAGAVGNLTADMNGDGDSADGGAEDAGYGNYDVFVSVFNSAGTWAWAKRLGGASTDFGYAALSDSSDNVVAVGYVYGNADMNGDGDSTDGGAETYSGSSNYDVFLSSFDSSGTWKWAKRIGATGAEYSYTAAINASNNIIVGGTITSNADMNGDNDNSDGGAEDGTSYGNADAYVSKFRTRTPVIIITQ